MARPISGIQFLTFVQWEYAMNETKELFHVTSQNGEHFTVPGAQKVPLAKITASPELFKPVLDKRMLMCCPNPNGHTWLPPSKDCTMWKYVSDKSNGVCAYCGASDEVLECEHIIGRGSTKIFRCENALYNLVLACRSCNGRKARKTFQEAGLDLKYLVDDKSSARTVEDIYLLHFEMIQLVFNIKA